MRVAVVANGALPDESAGVLQRHCVDADLVIAVDGGLAHCEAIGVVPDVLVGDLDSVDAGLVNSARDVGVELREFPADKDATDLELALNVAVEAGATSVTLLTAFGGRLDHQLAGISLFASPRFAAIDRHATDGQSKLWVVDASQSPARRELELPIGTTVSVVPCTPEVRGVRTTGLKWKLVDATLEFGTTWGISNVVTEPRPTVEAASGTLLVLVG